ncbi:MAG: Na(+)-translocating NADH-quinone reductase subunit A [Bacteroidota bacterium]|nr:Na(+)-translocating NADH-quinone reductase subunit A [Bacteroidota bacterium]
MGREVRLKKGLDINLTGEAEKVYASIKPIRRFSLKPTDFHSLTPKLVIKEGDFIKAGSPLFFDKYNDKINYCSPVSGEIMEIIRGDKRKIMEITINADEEIKYLPFDISRKKIFSREEIIQKMLQGGVWPFIRQKPYDIVASPNDMPKAIFISSFKSAPLAIDNDFALYGMEELFQEGLDYITKLTDGDVHLNLDGRTNSSKVFTEALGVQINTIIGPHPSGNVGVQIHHINPINKGEVVWYLEPQDVIVIARLFKEGKYDISRIISVSGAQIKKPRYYRVSAGACVSNLLENNLYEGNSRVISGDVFSGTKISTDGYLGFYDTELTVIPEGDKSEFLGWLLPGFEKFSNSRAYFSWCFPSRRYNLDTNIHGEERAYVVTGEYENVLPMNIYPVQLIKAIMAGDIDLMEKLGIYEVGCEDFALCDFICTSKIPVQDYIRFGLDLVRKENS